MPQPVAEQTPDVVIGEAVVDDAPGFTSGNHPTIPQLTKLVTQRRLADLQQEGQVADAELIGQAEGVEDPRPRCVGQHRESRCQVIGSREIDDASEQGSDVLGMQTFDLAALRG